MYRRFSPCSLIESDDSRTWLVARLSTRLDSEQHGTPRRNCHAKGVAFIEQAGCCTATFGSILPVSDDHLEWSGRLSTSLGRRLAIGNSMTVVCPPVDNVVASVYTRNLASRTCDMR